MNYIFKLILLIFILISSLNATECTTTTLTLDRQVISGYDDAEEKADTMWHSYGNMYMNSSDLELTEDNHKQIVGIRFQSINIPQGATITKAYIQFEVDETSSTYTSLSIKGEDVDNSQQFEDNKHNISNRTTTGGGFMGGGGSVSWNPPAWNHKNDHGVDQRTPDLRDIVQHIVNRGGWQNGNAMSFIITGSGKRVAESYDGESDASPILHIEYSGCEENNNNSNSTATCYALTDNSDKLYKVTMLPNGNPLPMASITNISTTFNGEGSAYRASDNKFYAFKGNSDDHGPSDLYTIDINTGDTTKIVDNIIAGAVDGAEFYFDPTQNKEILYIISGEHNSKLYAFDPDDWTPLSGYPKNTNTDLSSLAIDPITGLGYAIDDYNYHQVKPPLYRINLKTGATTLVTTLQNLADAEGLAFASDGNLYIEDEGRDDLVGKRLYMVNIQTGELTPSAITNSNGDIEGLSCNGTQMAIEYPSITIDGNSSIVEGNEGTSNLSFIISLSRPAVEDIVLSYTVIDESTVAGEDYLVESNRSILIPKDSNSANIIVQVKGDTVIESNETLRVKLIGATNAILNSTAKVSAGTIINDDNNTLIGECSQVFLGAISSTQNEIDLGTQSKIYNNGAPLVTKFLTVGIQADCDNGTCTKTNTLASNYAFDIELGDGSGENFKVPVQDSKTISQAQEFSSIKTKTQSTLTINGNHSFNIGGKFQIGTQSKIYLNGDMTFKLGTTFSMKTQSDLYVNGNVIIHANIIDIGTQAVIHLQNGTLTLIGNDISLGTQSNSTNNMVPDFIVLSNSNININTQGNIKGIFYSKNKTTIGTQAKVTGSITAKEIELKTQARVTYSHGLVDNYCNGGSTSTISGYIFEDKNHNGIKDNNENGLNKSSYIKLCKADNSFISSIEADSSTGLYTISNVEDGNYKLIEDASNSSDCSTLNKAEGYIPTTPNSINIIVSGANLSNKNFGNYSGSTVSGYVYNDIDKDGHKDENELGIENVNLEMRRCGNIAFTTTSTDANGHYTFWVEKRDDYADRWVGIWATDLDGYTSTGDEFDNGNGNQTEKNEAEEDHNWLCFSNRMDVNFEEGGQVLVDNNFGDVVETYSEPFTCSSDSYLTSSNDFFSLNFIDKNSTLLKENYTTENINAIGYNVKDNLIWGWSRSSKKIVQIDANYTVKEFDTDIPPFDFVAGDVSKDGILYLSGYDDSDGLENKFDNHTIYKLKIENKVPTYINSVPYSNTNIHFGDYAINPKDNHLYAIDSNSGHLFRLNLETGEANDLNTVSGLINNQTYFHSYVFDSDGNIYFYSHLNNATVYKINLSNVTADDISNPNFTATLFTNINGIQANGDGARCANAKMPDALEPIGCIANAFMFQNTNTDISALNLTNGDMKLAQSEPISQDTINSQGFNKKDGYFWGYNQTKKDGTITKIGLNPSGKWATKEFKIDGLDGFSSYVGDINSDGHLYLKEGGNSKRVVIIDLDPNSNNYLTKLPEIQLSKNLATADWAFNPNDNMLYAVNNGAGTKYLYKIDPNNGNIIYKKDTKLKGSRGFGASFFDANGFYYVYDNYSGEIFRIDVANSPTAILFSTAGVVSKNDGAMCTDAEFKFDFGDLPDNYPTLLESDGARHSLPTYGEPIIYMGSGVTHENNGKPSTNASLDSKDDGVKLNSGSLQGKTINAGATTTLEIITHGDGYLSAWIDWNNDGDFNDNLEKIATNIDGSDGVINLTFTSPSNDTDIVTYARFRYSYQQNLNPTGSAINGEVEDYKITIHANLEPFSCSQRLYLSNRSELGTGSVDSGATWLHGFYAMTPVYSPIGTGFTSENGGYNAIGYNVKDNFIYALYGNQLLKIDKNAHVKNLGAIEGLANNQLYAGEFDRDGFYYVSGGGGNDNKMYKIDIAQKKVIKTITLSSAVRFWDMAIDKSGDYFYTMLIKDGDSGSSFNNDKFAKINISTGEITTIGDSHKDKESYISLIFSDKNGKVIAIANDNGMYEINALKGTAYRIKSTPILNFYNDGTSCPNATFVLPPHIPRLSISDVAKAEGDDGQTNFEFEVSIDADLPMMPMGMPAMFFYRIFDGDENEITPPHDVALQSDHDFTGGSGIGINMNIFSNDRTQTISVPVYGDTKVEKDEEFFVEIYFPDFFPANFCMMGKNRAVGLILNDDMRFKVIRTNGDITNDSLYTQITGRDFDYSIVADGDININSMTLKIELIDNNDSTNNILYKGYKYIESGNRVDITDNSDLALLKATKDTSFRVSFLKDENGTIVHGNHASEEAYSNLENRVGYTQVSNESSDHFAIRPAGYKIEIKDKDEDNQTLTYRDSSYSGDDALKLFAGYTYKIDARAVAYDIDNSTIIGYTTNSTSDINTTLIFNDKTACNDKSNAKLDYKFNNGAIYNASFKHNNVGEYKLYMEDTTWTVIDQNSDSSIAGCIPNSSAISDNGNEKSGCNISTDNIDKYHDIKINFNPYSFNINHIVLDNYNKDGRDYLYMNNLNSSSQMSVQIHSNIIAESYNGEQLSNFTKSCVAKKSLLSLDFKPTFKGNYSNNNGQIKIKTQQGSSVYPQQIVKVNGNNGNVEYFKDINIKSEYFLDENEGNLTLDILYNMEKNIHEETNPIKILFDHFDINTTSSKAMFKGKEIFPIQKENSGSINKTRIFFYARIRSDREVYPETAKRVIHTPLMIEIYCKVKHDENWCKEDMRIKDIGISGYESYQGWYIDRDHNSSIDGNVTALNSSNPDFVVSPTDIPPFKTGRIDDIYVKYSKKVPDSLITTQVDIITQSWLRYNRDTSTDGTPNFKLRIKDVSEMTGIGAGGNQAEITKKLDPNGKIDW